MLQRVLVVLGAAALLGACRPEVDFGTHERQSQIDRVAVRATVGADGNVHVEQHYTFASADGGKVALPDLAGLSPGIPGAANVTVDGQPATASSGTFHPQLEIKRRHATVAYDVRGAVSRYEDIAVVEVDVLPSPENASRQDPDVPLSGTLTLPEGPPGTIEPHNHGGRDRTVAVQGNVITFSATAPIWFPEHKLAVAFPAERVPYVRQTPITFLAQFQTTQRLIDQADNTTEGTLTGVDESFDVARWILTAVAFGLPAIFWLGVGKGLLRRLRDRHRVVGKVPDHLSDPPTQADPAVVAVLAGEGHPARTAVAGTVLALAQRKAVDLQSYGDHLVVKVPLQTTGTNGSEEIVLNALRSEATDEGVIEGPPVWRRGGWWRAFRRDAIRRARDQGFVTRWMPLAPLSGALITTGIGFSVFFFSNPLAYFIIVFGVQIVGFVITFLSGWTLTNQGWRDRALWHAFARYIRDQGHLDKDVGPDGVVMWGPYLVYGSVLGEAHAAARPLTP
jgi:hypothetical protein